MSEFEWMDKTPGECFACGQDHGDLSHALACGNIKPIQVDCPECGEEDCSALFLVDGATHVSWCARGHVVVGNALSHMLVYLFL